MGGKASAASKNKYAAKSYDRIGLVVPKGRKADIENRVNELGLTGARQGVNTYICNLIKADLKMSEDEWKGKPLSDD